MSTNTIKILFTILLIYNTIYAKPLYIKNGSLYYFMYSYSTIELIDKSSGIAFPHLYQKAQKRQITIMQGLNLNNTYINTISFIYPTPFYGTFALNIYGINDIHLEGRNDKNEFTGYFANYNDMLILGYSYPFLENLLWGINLKLAYQGMYNRNNISFGLDGSIGYKLYNVEAGVGMQNIIKPYMNNSGEMRNVISNYYPTIFLSYIKYKYNIYTLSLKYTKDIESSYYIFETLLSANIGMFTFGVLWDLYYPSVTVGVSISDWNIGYTARLNINSFIIHFISISYCFGKTRKWYIRDIENTKKIDNQIERAWYYYKNGDKDRAKEILADTILKFPDASSQDKVMYNLAKLYRKVGDKENEILVMDKLTKQFPESEYAAEAYYVKGKYYKDRGRYEKAQREFERLESDFEDTSWASQYFIDRAKESIKYGDEKQYEKYLKKSVKYIFNEDGYRLLFNYYYDRGRYDEALECIDEIEKASTINIEDRKKKIQIYKKIGKFESALEEIDKVLTQVADTPTKLNMLKDALAICIYKNRDYSLAEYYINLANRNHLKDRDIQAYSTLLKIIKNKKIKQKVLKDRAIQKMLLKMAKSIDKDTAKKVYEAIGKVGGISGDIAWYRLAQYYFKKGNYSMVIKILKNISRSRFYSPRMLDARLMLGFAYYKLGQVSKMIRVFKTINKNLTKSELEKLIKRIEREKLGKSR